MQEQIYSIRQWRTSAGAGPVAVVGRSGLGFMHGDFAAEKLDEASNGSPTPPTAPVNTASRAWLLIGCSIVMGCPVGG